MQIETLACKVDNKYGYIYIYIYSLACFSQLAVSPDISIFNKNICNLNLQKSMQIYLLNQYQILTSLLVLL